jgi:hypothetical protein
MGRGEREAFVPVAEEGISGGDASTILVFLSFAQMTANKA